MPEPAGSLSDLAGQAQQRAGRARVLGSLLVQEPGSEEIALARRLPSLAPLLAGASSSASPDPVSDLRVDYARVLLRDVACHESVFLGPTGDMGIVDPTLLNLYDRWDFTWEGRWRVAAGDHLGVQLLYYAHLCDVERDAWSQDRPDRATQAVETERLLMCDHLGRWGPLAADALIQAGAGTVFAPLGRYLADMLADEFERLRPAAEHPGMPSVQLSAAATGGTSSPAAIARRLLSPERSGGYLTTAAIGRLAHRLQAPWRPSDTRSRLRHVIEAAADCGRPSEVAETLRPLFRSWSQRWTRERDAHPGAARIFEGWRLRAMATATWLGELQPRPEGRAAVLVVSDQEGMAQALAALSAAGLVVTTDDAPPPLLAQVDAVVRLGAGEDAGWEQQPPLEWPETLQRLGQPQGLP